MCEILSQAVNELLVYGQKCWKLTFDHQNPVQVDILKFLEIYLIPPAMAVAEGKKTKRRQRRKNKTSENKLFWDIKSYYV